MKKPAKEKKAVMKVKIKGSPEKVVSGIKKLVK
jgi:hypothetical protein